MEYISTVIDFDKRKREADNYYFNTGKKLERYLRVYYRPASHRKKIGYIKEVS